MRDIDVVILAGGMGTRLQPHTFAIPKALIRLGAHPIIEILLRQLESCGARRVHLALGHRADLIQAHLEQAQWRSRLPIAYSLEERPLGTVGPITLLHDLSETFMLINADVLTTLSYQQLLDYHRRRGCVATVAVHRRQIQTSYGIVELSDDARIAGHREKPLLALDVAMGVYVFQRRVADRIPAARRFDVPDLIASLIAAAAPIAAYQSSDYWMDVGCPDDFAIAQRDFAAAPERFLNAPRQPTAETA